MAMVVLILDYMEWPFVLQFSSSPLDFDSSPFFLGACFCEVDFGDLEANLIFTVLYLVEVDFGDLEAS